MPVAEQTVSQMERRIEALEAALKPLAALAAHIPAKFDDKTQINVSIHTHLSPEERLWIENLAGTPLRSNSAELVLSLDDVTAGDLRSAHALMQR